MGRSLGPSQRVRSSDARWTWLRPLLFLALAAMAVSLFVLQQLPASLERVHAVSAEFSLTRARSLVARIAQEPHPVGSRAHADTRRLIQSELRSLGLEVIEQHSSAAMRMAGTEQSARLVNLLAIVSGRDPSAEAVMLTAHYDSAPNSRGAGDDGAAVAALLETARVLESRPELRRDVYFLFSDAEEVGLLGAEAFVREHPLARRVGVVLNFEARGSRGPELMYQTSRKNGALVRAFARAARYPHANSLISRLSRVLPNDADTSIYERAGYPVLGFAFAEGLENYHQYSDSPENLDARSLAHAGTLALDLASHLAELDRLPTSTSDAVYFDLCGRWLVTYPVFVARALAILLFIGWLGLLRRDLKAQRVSPRGILRGVTLQLASLACALVVPLISMLGRALTVDAARLLRHAPAYGWCDLLVVAALFLPLYARAAASVRTRELVLGGLALAAGLSLVLGSFAPDASAPWQWLLAASLLVWWLEPRISAHNPALGIAWQHVTLAVAVAVFGPVVITAIAVAGPSLTLLPIVIAATTAAVFLPTLIQRGIPRPQLTAAALAGLGLALMVVHTWLGRAPLAATPRTSLVYAYDVGTKEARLATEPTARVADFEALIPPASPVGTLRGFTQCSGSPWRHTSADDHSPLAARVTARPLTTTSEHRIVELQIEPRVFPRCVRLWQIAGGAIGTTQIDGKQATALVRFSPAIDEFGMQLMSGRFAPHVWNLHHCGFDREPLRIRLQVQEPTPARLRLVEEHEVLPGPIVEKLRALGQPCPPSSSGETWIAQDILL